MIEEENNCPEFVKPLKRSCPTNYLYISNANTSSENILEDLQHTFLSFGNFNNSFGPIFISKKKVSFSSSSSFFYLSLIFLQHLCYICYENKESTQKVIEYSEKNDLYVGNRKVIVRYADLSRIKISPPEPECISETVNVNVPGLYLIPEFVTFEEEKELLDFADGKDENGKLYWKSGLTRRVQVINLHSSSSS